MSSIELERIPFKNEAGHSSYKVAIEGFWSWNNIRELKNVLRHGRQPEEKISQDRTVLSLRFLFCLSLIKTKDTWQCEYGCVRTSKK